MVLPMSIRMKGANRRGWMLDRKNNIKFLVHAMQAYRHLATPLAREGTFEQNRVQLAPFSTFGQQSLDLEYEAFALMTALEDLEAKHYPGVGNDVHKLQHAMDSLENTAALRYEEDKMMAMTKTAMLKAIQLAKLPGFEDLPLRDQMRSATFPKEDVVRQLAETLKLDAPDVAQLVQNSPALMPRPLSRQRTPLPSSLSSPPPPPPPPPPSPVVCPRDSPRFFVHVLSDPDSPLMHCYNWTTRWRGEYVEQAGNHEIVVFLARFLPGMQLGPCAVTDPAAADFFVVLR